MEEMKKALFMETVLAEETLKNSINRNGAEYETFLCRRNYEELLDLIEASGWFEEYRSFKIMTALYLANREKYKLLPASL